MQTFEGQLEVDNDRGVIYFHSNDPKTHPTILRICSLGKLPELGNDLFDISHMIGHNGDALTAIDYYHKNKKYV